MMIGFALVAELEHGKNPPEAVREASLVRFRPIMMTAMVAIIAALPIAISLGEGSELRRLLGVALIGGLLVSQSLTLLGIPAPYVTLSGLPSGGRRGEGAQGTAIGGRGISRNKRRRQERGGSRRIIRSEMRLQRIAAGHEQACNGAAELPDHKNLTTEPLYVRDDFRV